MDTPSVPALLVPMMCLAAPALARSGHRAYHGAVALCVLALLVGQVLALLLGLQGTAALAEGLWIGSWVFFGGIVAVLLGIVDLADVALLAAAAIWFALDGLVLLMGGFGIILSGVALMARLGQVRVAPSPEAVSMVRQAAVPLAALLALAAMQVGAGIP